MSNPLIVARAVVFGLLFGATLAACHHDDETLAPGKCCRFWADGQPLQLACDETIERDGQCWQCQSGGSFAACERPFECDTGRTLCGGVCVDLDTNRTHCGGCGVVCPSFSHGLTSTCSAGECKPTGSCDPGYQDCNDLPTDGCETSLYSPTSCGACGVVCPTDAPFCESFTCVDHCDTKLISCGGTCVDPQTDVAHCGVCDHACPAALANQTVSCRKAACIATCAASFVECATGCCPSWPVDVIDPILDGGEIGATAFVLDELQNEHVVYLSTRGPALIYAHRSGAAFTLERVTTLQPTQWSYDVRIARSSDGVLHATYFLLDLAKPDVPWTVWYARRVGATWTNELVATLAPATLYNELQIAVSPDGAAHLVYTTDHCNYAHRDPDGTWTTEPLDFHGRPRLAVTSDGTPLIAYNTDDPASGVFLATRAGAAWTSIAIPELTGIVTALTLDADDHPYVVLQTSAGYAETHRLDTTWETFAVGSPLPIRFAGGAPYSLDATPFTNYVWKHTLRTFTTTWDAVATQTLLYVDLSDYQLDPTGAPTYLHRGLLEQSPYAVALGTTRDTTTTMIDAPRAPGRNVQLATVGSTTHFLYYDDLRAQSVHATRDGGVITVDVLPSADPDAVLVGTATTVHVCTAKGALDLLQWTGSGWTRETIPSTTGALACGLAFDSAGTPHVGLRTATQVFYLRKTTGSWERVALGNTNVTSRVLIALDATERPHVLFQDGAGLELSRLDGTTPTTGLLAVGDAPGASFAFDSAGTAHLLIEGKSGGVDYAWLDTTLSRVPLNDTPTCRLILDGTTAVIGCRSLENGVPTAARLSIVRITAMSLAVSHVLAMSFDLLPGLTLQNGKLQIAIADSDKRRVLLTTEP